MCLLSFDVNKKKRYNNAKIHCNLAIYTTTNQTTISEHSKQNMVLTVDINTNINRLKVSDKLQTPYQR